MKIENPRRRRSGAGGSGRPARGDPLSPRRRRLAPAGRRRRFDPHGI